MKKILLLLVALVILVWGMWIAVPVTAMESMIEDFGRNQNVMLDVEGLHKGFFYRLYADRIVLKRAASDLIILSSVHATINPFYLAMMRMECSVNGRLGEGSFSGNASLRKNTIAIYTGFGEARVADIPVLATAGIKGKGTISGNITVNDLKGRLQFFVNDAALEPMIIQGVPAPLNFFRTVHGSLDVDGGTVTISSVSLEGPDISARLKGIISDGVMDLHMEVMPEKSLLENPLFLSEVDRYQVSPGYYVIPIKGPLYYE